MAFELGGVSDKLGNRFEQRWVVRQMLRVVAGRVRSIQYEAIGDDERGVDLWVDRLDGVREAQQCKGSFGTRNSLTIAGLDSLGILDGLQTQLSRKEVHSFSLVAPIPAIIFNDLADSARANSGTIAEFREQLKVRSEPHRSGFRTFCNALGYDHAADADAAAAMDLLRRCRHYHFVDDPERDEEIRYLAQTLVDGDPQAVIATLQDYAVENLRKTLTADKITRYLSDRGFTSKVLVRDERLVSRIESLNRAFTEAVREHLIAGALVKRPETDTVFAELLNSSGAGIVAVEGLAGAGKSSVLYELTERLRVEGFPFLTLRVDRQMPQGSPRMFGEHIDLPEAPTLCLSHLAGDRVGVLVLDQLDALRSSSSNAGDAWSVCREMFRQAEVLGNIRIVVACRSFELNHDPQFKVWSDSAGLKRVVVGDLSESILAETVTRAGRSYEKLQPQLKSLLQRPQNLSMWLDLPRGEDSIESLPELLGAFWRHHYSAITRRGVSSSDLETVVAECVSFMEAAGRQVMPLRRVDAHIEVVEALQSQGLVDLTSDGLAFGHQSYLDYQIATRALAALDAGGSIRDWLENGSGQTLARREPVRHLLGLLRVEDRDRFLATTRRILHDAKLRFHLRLLALQVLAESTAPTEEEGELALSLLRDRSWREHGLNHIFWRRPEWLTFLHREGTLEAWLDSDAQEDLNTSAWLLRSVATLDGDFVARLLRPRLDRTDFSMIAEHVLPAYAHEDTDELFDIRLRLVPESENTNHVSWTQLAENRPDRCWPILDAHLKRLVPQALEQGSTPRVEIPGFDKVLPEHYVAGLSEAARSYAAQLWQSTLACLEQLDREEWSYSTAETPWLENCLVELPQQLETLVAIAGAALCREHTEEFLRGLPRASGVRSVGWLRAISRALTEGPSAVADAALGWLMEDPRRLRLGDRFEEEPWEPARRLIERHSAACSHEVYRAFEDFTLTHHDGDEWRSMRARLGDKGRRANDPPNRFGQGQFFLLGALPQDRMSAKAMGMLGVLRAKFAKVSPLFFGRVVSTGVHRVRSPLPPERLLCLSNRTWLGILTRDPAILKDRPGGGRVGDLTESTVEAFAADLNLAACKDPSRFAALAMAMPTDVPYRYVETILSALAHPRPPHVMDPEEQAKWRPASGDALIAVLERFEIATVSAAMSFCRIIGNHPDVEWSGRLVDQLIDIAATHPNPEREELVIRRLEREDAGLEQLENSALNCVRGAAAHAITMLLFRGAEWLTRLRGAVDALVADNNPAVRLAAIETLLPILNYDRDLAVGLFLRCMEDTDELLLASHYAWSFYNHASQSHLSKLAPVFGRMIRSTKGVVSRAGASAMCAMWIRDGEMGDELENCLRGGAEHRVGVAAIAATTCREPEWSKECLRLLLRLVSDEDRRVRDEVSRVFYQLRDLKSAKAVEFASAYVQSRSFRESPSALVHALERLEGDLSALGDVVLAVCGVFARHLATESRDWSTSIAGDARSVGPLLLRVYEQARSEGNATVADRALDMWDELLRQRVGDAHSVLAEFEA